MTDNTVGRIEDWELQDVHPFLRKHTEWVTPETDDGETARAARRANRVVQHRRFAVGILVEKLPSIATGALDMDAYEEEWEAAFHAIVESKEKIRRIREAQSFFTDFVIHVNRINGARLEVPPDIVRATRTPSFRSKKWFLGAAKLKE